MGGANVADADARFGGQVGDEVGVSVATGDINGDGFLDIAISRGAGSGAGYGIYVVFGKGR